MAKSKIVTFKPQYIEITRDMTFREVLGRYTKLVQGAYGFLLDESIIDRLKITPEQRADCMERFNSLEEDQILALVAGYLIELREKDFIILKKPLEMAIPPGTII